jgi:CubicO group peptidase (beta-lactamase class C family)
MGAEHIGRDILPVENRIMRCSARSMIMGILLISLGVLSGCVSDAPFKFVTSTVPEQLNDGWEVASPEEVDVNQEALNEVYSAFVSEDRYFNAKSLLVVKNGKLVFEAYCRTPKDRDRYGHVASVTKSVTSLLFGIAMTAGYIDSLDQPLYSIIPDKFPSDLSKRSITLRHLLTMTSGLSFDNDDFSVEIYADKPGDPAKYILKKPLYAPPGEKFYYRDADPHLLSYAMQRLTGKSEEELAEEYLFDPLGIRDYYWDSDHTGTTMGAHGLHLEPRDMAKIGQMVLDHGRWQGRQVVDSSWVAASTQKQVETDHKTEPHVYHYGYYWWILPRWNAFTAWGQGGNFIFVLPEKQMVIVMTSLPDVDDDVVGTKLDEFEELISPLLAGDGPG